jgi:hypothetical protein
MRYPEAVSTAEAGRDEELPMRKIEDVLRLHAQGFSTRRMSLATGVGKTTVIEYLRRARAAGVSWPLPEGLDEATLERLRSGCSSRRHRRRRGAGSPSRTGRRSIGS